MEKLKKYLNEHLNDHLALLQQMVRINSFTANAEGVDNLGKLTAASFSNLGFQPEYVPSESSTYGHHLFLRRPASNTPPVSKAPSLVLISHLDTVFSPDEEIQNDFQWRILGNRIYGPGTVDIKGGTVIIRMVLDALQALQPDAFNSVDWLIAANASEEVLSDDFAARIQERMTDNTRACLVFEGGTLSDKGYPLVIARKGRATFKVSVEGKSAHAGNNHAQGANAILQMAHTIQQIEAMTNYQNQITYNVGTVAGGVVVNRVPHFAEASVEMRAFDPEIFETGCQNMLALNGKSQIASTEGYPCQVKITLIDKTAPWPPHPDTLNLFDLWKKTADNLDINIIPEKRGGLSDGNMLWQHCPTLDGLGPSGGNAHCSERSEDGSKDQEYALSSSFVPKALVNAMAILELIQNER